MSGPRRSRLPRLHHPRAKAGVAGQLGRRGKAGDLADLGGDREGQDRADPRHRQELRNVGVLGAAPLKPGVDLRDLGLECVDQLEARQHVAEPRLRDLELGEQLAARHPEEIRDRAGAPEAHQGRVDPVLQLRAVLDQVEAKAGELSLLPDPRVGQPDRRHQVALGEQGQHPGVDPVGLRRQRRQALDLLGVCDLDRPAERLEGVVDEAGAGHRLDHPDHRLAVGVDPACQPSQAVAIRRAGELLDQLALIGEQADVDPLASLDPAQRATCVGASLVSVFRLHVKRGNRGGPSSCQSKAAVRTTLRNGHLLSPSCEGSTPNHVLIEPPARMESCAPW